MQRVKTNLRNKNAMDVLRAGRSVLLGMTGNPHFPAPLPSMAEFKAACDALDESVRLLADGGSRAEYTTKNLRQAEVSNMLRSLAGYVGAVAQGDPSIVHGAGFELAKRSVNITSMNAPKDLVAKPGTHPCTIQLRWKPVKGTRMYQIHICLGSPNDPANWSPLAQTSSSRYLVEGLKPLEYYIFRVHAVGAHTKSPVSDIATALSIGPKWDLHRPDFSGASPSPAPLQ